MQKKFNLNDLSFDAVVPSVLALNKKIVHCLPLYIIIRSLTKAIGYCFASNAYLANTLEVDESTITRNLKTLCEEGFLEVETKKTGIISQRLIYISDEFKKSLRKCIDAYPPPHACLPPSAPTPTVLEEYSKERVLEDSCLSDAPVGPSVSKKVKKLNSKGEEVTISLESIFSYAVNKRPDWKIEEIQEAWSILVDCNGPVNCPYRFVEGIIDKRRNLKKFEKYEKSKKVMQCTTTNTKEEETKNPGKNSSPIISDSGTQSQPSQILKDFADKMPIVRTWY
jgi:DNA-binding MarR family transcriptional regulator